MLLHLTKLVADIIIIIIIITIIIIIRDIKCTSSFQLGFSQLVWAGNWMTVKLTKAYIFINLLFQLKFSILGKRTLFSKFVLL